MIFRVTQKLSRKIKAGPLAKRPAHENPYADWSARVFVANRVQYILLSNTASLFSAVMHGRGITDGQVFATRAMECIHETMAREGLELLYLNFIANTAESPIFAKSLNCSVTGSLNEFQWHAQDSLAGDGLSPIETSAALNSIPCSPLSTPDYPSFASPKEAIRFLMA